MNTFRAIVYSFLIVLFAVILLTECSGCSILRPRTEITPTTGKELMIKTVMKTDWLLTFSIIGVGAGFMAFINGHSKGLSIMAACLVVLSLVIAIARFATWIAVLAMIGGLLAVGYTIWVRSRALKEVVEGGEKYKDRIHTHGIFSQSQTAVQSPETSKLVKKIKGKLK